MKTKIYITLILQSVFISLGLKINAQTASYQWVKVFGGSGYDIGNSVAVDQESGDVYTTGIFSGTFDFEPGREIFTLTSAGNNDIFIAKTNASGHLVWVKTIGGPLNDGAFSIAVDASGNVYITGQFSSTVDFDPGPAMFNLTSAGSVDIFILKLDSSGNYLWAKAIGGPGYDVGKSLAVDPSVSGDVYIKGEFNGTVDFDPGKDTLNLKAVDNSNGTFIVKLDTNGNLVWALNIGAATNGGSMGVALYGGFGHSVMVDVSGNIYCTGWFNGTVDFDPGADSFKLTATGVNDIFILKLDALGNFAWAKKMGGTIQGVGHSMAEDASGNIYLTGAFSGTIDFDPGEGENNLTARSNVFGDIFIVKLDNSGNFVWAKAMGGTGGDSGSSIAVDSESGDIYTIGNFSGTADLDPEKGIFNLTSAGDLDVFISKIDESGRLVWAKSIGGLQDDYGYSIALNSLNNIYVVGGFKSPAISFDTTSHSNAGDFDIFFAKLNDSQTASVANIKTPQINIYPNPVSNELFLEHEEGAFLNVDIKLSTLLGEVVYLEKDQHIEHRQMIDVSKLPTGIYFVELNIDGNIVTKKVVKE